MKAASSPVPETKERLAVFITTRSANNDAKRARMARRAGR
jgi:hypothetical protein